MAALFFAESGVGDEGLEADIMLSCIGCGVSWTAVFVHVAPDAAAHWLALAACNIVVGAGVGSAGAGTESWALEVEGLERKNREDLVAEVLAGRLGEGLVNGRVAGSDWKGSSTS